MPNVNEEFLDLTGLSYFKGRLDNVFPAKSDFDALEDKVDEIIAEGGEPNVIEVVKVNGTALTPVNKAVDVTVPEDLSDLTNTGADPFANESDIPTKVSELTNDTDASPVYKYSAYSGFIDLSNYWDQTNLTAITTAQIDALFA